MSATRKKSPKGKRNTPKPKTSGRWKLVLVAVILLLSPFYYGYVLKAVVSSWRWVHDIGLNPRYPVYKSFNIRMPEKYKVCGIDVSYYQGNINWQSVKSMHEKGVHISFAFIKATEGLIKVDPYFQRNWRECPRAGIACGAYHYFRPQLNGQWQAKFFLQNVKPKKGQLPLVADVEELDGVTPEKMREQLKAFIKHIETKTKTKPIIYSSLKFYQNYLSGYFDDYTLWIAHYYEPELQVSHAAKWKFWQHSDKAKVNGINHVVDFNVFNGDSLSFKKLLLR